MWQGKSNRNVLFLAKLEKCHLSIGASAENLFKMFLIPNLF